MTQDLKTRAELIVVIPGTMMEFNDFAQKIIHDKKYGCWNRPGMTITTGNKRYMGILYPMALKGLMPDGVIKIGTWYWHSEEFLAEIGHVENITRALSGGSKDGQL